MQVPVFSMDLHSTDEHVSLFEPGAVIAGRYEVVNLLGKGGMGMVLRVIDRSLDNEPTALKLLYPHHVKDPVVFARFRNEVLVARSLAHPNIVRIYDFGVAGKGYFYISMEFVQGYSLKERIHSPHYKDLDFPEICRILYGIGEGLAYAHRKGVVHRDMKPDNILLTPGGEIRISDFGLARSVNIDKGFTQTGETVGTPCYMAPEQIRGQKVDARADIYSLGILAYEMATGTRPFEDESWYTLAKMHMTQPIPAFAKEFDIPNWFEEFVFQSAAKSPDERFNSVDEWCDELANRIDPGAGRRRGLSPAVFSKTLTSSITDQRKKKKLRKKIARTTSALLFGGLICAASLILIRGVPVVQHGALRTVSVVEKSTGARFPGIKRLAGLNTSLTSKTLEDLITKGDLEQVRTVLASGIDLNSREGTPPLIFAIQNKQITIAEELIKNGAHVDVRSEDGKTPLAHAAELDLAALISPLLKAGADVNERDGMGRTPLMLAAASGELSAVQILIAQGALASLTDETPEALPATIHAVNGGSVPVLQAILDKSGKSAANAVDAKRTSALMYAAEAGREDMIAVLIAAGADSEAKNLAGKTYRDFLPAKSRVRYAQTQPTRNEAATHQAFTRLRMIGDVEVEKIVGRSIKIRALKATIRNAGDEKAAEVKVAAILPGGQRIPLSGSTEMESNAVQTFSANINPAAPIEMQMQGAIKIEYSCKNCYSD